MCFSAEASFGASAILGVIGVAALKKTTKPDQRLFAAIPLFFSVQQLCEGFVWLSFMNPGWENYRQIFAYLFLIFALLIWPVWVPLSVWLLEERRRLKKLQLAALGFGLVFAGLVGFYLFTHSVFPEIKEHHIHYALGFSGGLARHASLLYFIPTIIPPLLSSHRRVWVLGLFLFISYLVSKYYFAQAVVSVWCFLAAFISFLVLWVVMNLQERKELPGRKPVLVED